MILHKLAVFKHVEGGYMSPLGEWADKPDSGYVRMTEYLDCRFEELPVEDQIKDELILLDKMADEIKKRAVEGLANIEKRRGELLALTHEV